MAGSLTPLPSFLSPTDTSPTSTSSSSLSSTTSTSTAASTSTSSTSTSTTSTSTSTSSTTSTSTSTSASSATPDTSTTSSSTTTTSSSQTTSTDTSTSVTPSPTLGNTSSTDNTLTLPPTGTGAGISTITGTSTVLVGAPTDSSSSDTQHASKGFFQNTGEVAGVFAAVGVVVVIIIVFLVTNAVRRRRAKELDREIAEAAAEAANAAPAFTDDDYYPDDRLGKGGPGGDLRSMTTTGYSDTTHGTFVQPPMGHVESYNMAELSPYDYGAAATGAAGAAGIGAMGLNRARSMASNNQTAPYNAFAGPQPGMSNPYDDPAGAYGQQQNQHYRQQPAGHTEMNLLDAAGLGAAATAGYAAHGYGQPQNGTNLARNPSFGPSQATSPSEYSSYGAHPQMQQGGYSQDYNAYHQDVSPAPYNPFQQAAPQGYPPQSQYGSSPPPQQSPETSPLRPLSTVSAADPYGGYVDEPAAAVEAIPGHASSPPHVQVQSASPPPERLLGGNFASPPASSEGHEDHRISYQDEDDYGYEPRRILKVANE